MKQDLSNGNIILKLEIIILLQYFSPYTN